MTAPGDWQGFAEMIGGASGALTGLLFVAVSLNASRIAGNQGLRASAAQTLMLFLAPLFMAAALLTPDQPNWALGAEFIAIGGGTSWILLSRRRGVKHSLTDDDKQLIAIFNRRGTNVMVMLLFVASGIILACGQPDGLYLLLPASLVAQISGILNAWLFLLPPTSSSPS